MTEDEKLTEHINFRLAHNTYMELMDYLKKTNETISKFMREATYEYLKLRENFKREINKDGNGKKETIVNNTPEAIKYCDGDKCEIDYSKISQNQGCGCN